MLQFTEQNEEEQNTSEDADDQLNGDFIREDHDSRKDIADQHEQCSRQRGIHKRSANLISLEHRDHIGDDQTDVGDLSDNDHDTCRNRRRNRKTEEKNELVIDGLPATPKIQRRSINVTL